MRSQARTSPGEYWRQQARVLGIQPETALPQRHFLAHHSDLAVAVEVFVAVLVHAAVAVVIDPDGHGARETGRGGRAEPLGAAVGVGHGQDVEHGAVQQLGDARELAVVLEHVVDQVEAHLGALDLVGVRGRVDVHGRLAELRRGLGVVDGYHPHLAAGARLADALQGDPRDPRD
jgi:hypothetical protein